MLTPADIDARADGSRVLDPRACDAHGDDAPGIDVSIIVVSFNTRALTLAAIRSAKAETRDASIEIICVDNASSDGSAAAIRSAFPDVRLVALDANIGFARANNLAAREARGRYLLLLNPDTVVLDRAVDRLVGFARARPSAMIWGGRTLYADGRLNPASCWGRMTPWRLVCRATGLAAIMPWSETFNGEAYGAWPRDRVREVDIVSGCFLMIERATWQRLGGFDALFFMYGEEADLCLRARVLGARPAVTPEATIVHLGGASETVRADKMCRLLAAKASLIDRHFAPGTRRLGRFLLALWPVTRAVATGVLARLTGREDHHATARTWAEVLARRRSWRTGWQAVPPTGPAASHAIAARAVAGPPTATPLTP